MLRCNVCAWTGSAWNSFSGRKAACPRCKSLERHRAMFRALKEAKLFPAPRENWTVVSVSLDRSLVAHFYREYFHQIVDIAPQNAFIRKASLLKLPYPTQGLDMLVHSHVLEHIRNDAAALAEVYRVLKPGGVMVSSVPCTSERTIESARAMPPHGHWRSYGVSDYLALLQHVGFADTKMYGPWPDPEFNMGPDPIFISTILEVTCPNSRTAPETPSALATP